MVSKDSSINIGNRNNFGGDTAIGENARIEKHIHDNSINYTGDRLDLTSIENFSKNITNNYDEKKVSLWAGILAGIGLIGDTISINSVLPSGTKIINFIPKFNLTFGWIIFSVCLLFLIVGIWVISAIKYKYDSTCPKCSKHYAMKESKNPAIREVRAYDGIKRTTTRNYKCKYCSYEKEASHTETIPYGN